MIDHYAQAERLLRSATDIDMLATAIGHALLALTDAVGYLGYTPPIMRGIEEDQGLSRPAYSIPVVTPDLTGDLL